MKIVEEFDNGKILVELTGTRYYQIWNKWKLYELLLANGEGRVTLIDEDFPMKREEVDELLKKV